MIKLKQWKLINIFIEHILYGCDSEYQNIMKSFNHLELFIKKCFNQLTNKHSHEKLYEFKKENNLINANDEQINEEITTQLNNVNTFFAALFRTEPSFDLIYFAKFMSTSLTDVDKEISALYSFEDLIDGFMKNNVKKDIIFKIMEFNYISHKEVEQIIQTLFVQKNESLLKPEETTIQSSLIITFVNTEYTINFNNSLNCSDTKVVLEDMSMSVISKIFESEYVKELNITPTGGKKIKIIMDDKIQEEELSQT